MCRDWRPLGLLLGFLPWAVVGLSSASSVAPAKHANGLTPIEAWRKTDVHGRACASCHSPDGIEVAAYNFPDDDLLRRARGHLSAEDAPLAVEFVHDVRKRYRIQTLLDPMRDRPMQPGGEVLAGATPVERDQSFAKSLPAIVPLFFSGRIDSLSSAQAARDQLLAVDLAQLKVGISMNRLSEDVFHGKEHASIADWLADVPLAVDLPVSLQDAYIAEPSEKNYEALDSALSRQEQLQKTPAQLCSLNKRRAVLYYAQYLHASYTGGQGPVRPADGNPMWNLGEFGRQFGAAPIQTLGLPPDLAVKKLSGPNSADQMKELRLAWYWLGWVLDPGLQRSGAAGETQRADYFTRFLWADGPYPMHTAFMTSRKIASESFVPASWNDRAPQHLDLNYSALLSDTGYFGAAPKDAEHLHLLNTFVANSFRMNLYLLIDELSRTRVVYLRLALLQQLRRMRTIFSETSDMALVDRAAAVIGLAKDVGGNIRGGRISG